MFPKYFRLLVVASFVLSMLAAFYDVIFLDYSVKEVSKFASSVEEISQSTYVFFRYYGYAGVVVNCLIHIGLFLYWPISRWLVVFSYVIFLPVMPFFGVIVLSAKAMSISYISSVLSGVILTLIFTSPVKECFFRKK